LITYIVQMVQCIYVLLTIYVAVRTSTHNSCDFNIYYSSNIALQIMKLDLYNFRKINIFYYRIAVCIIIIIVNFINIYDIYKKLSTLFATFFFAHLLYHLISTEFFVRGQSCISKPAYTYDACRLKQLNTR